ncbi:hypothetical protein ACFQ1S_05680 [Kibdelosporangium lantanae]|uniref:Uncharacterized protein n=1 Tax=Kibdelosporangium lantanae TaxID=1497396 RepID=A0ABW3M4A2_9PSEU
MATDLDSSVSTSQWMLNAFNLTFAALPLTASSLPDRPGHRCARQRQRGETASASWVRLSARVWSSALGRWAVD